MAELLVRVHDKINPDFYLNTKCTKRGDVIDVEADGWPWGSLELSLPFFRIIKMTGFPVATARSWLAAEVDVDPLNPSKTLQRRASFLAIDNPALIAALPPALAAYLADDTRAAPTFTLPLVNALAFQSLVTLKAPIVDPAVIGAAPSVIGP